MSRRAGFSLKMPPPKKIVFTPSRLTWNIIMDVWKIIFLSKWVICRFQPLTFQGVNKKNRCLFFVNKSLNLKLWSHLATTSIPLIHPATDWHSTGTHYQVAGGERVADDFQKCCVGLFPLVMYLEDHPMTCKWLITMVIVSPLSRVIPLPNGLSGL